jgi:hypothetical protein
MGRRERIVERALGNQPITEGRDENMRSPGDSLRVSRGGR